MRRMLLAILMGFTLLSAAPVLAAYVNFEDLTPTIAYSDDGYYENGPNMTTVSTSTGSWGQTIHHNAFVSGGATFKNNYVPDWSSWDGWAYSNTTDTATAGFTNQFSAITGSAQSGSNYGVFFETFGELAPTIDFGGPVTLTGAYITNTTYAYKAVVEGNDGNTPPFIKGPFDRGDWFKTTVYGFDGGGNATTSLEIYLADYRDANPSNWYALNTWTQFDLSTLGIVYGLGFDLSSTDTGQFGMNTPAYFAMDDLNYNAVPIPGSVLLLGSGLLCLFGIRRRRSI